VFFFCHPDFMESCPTGIFNDNQGEMGTEALALLTPRIKLNIPSTKRH